MKKFFPLLLAFTLALFTLPLPAPAAPAGAEPSAPSPVYDLNTVTFEELVTVKGIGPVLAERIVGYRTSRGPFTSVEDLLEVKGIGDKSLARLRSRFTVSPPPSPVARSTAPQTP